MVARYSARYPAVSVDLHLTGRMVDLVAEGFDVALRVAPKLEDSTLVVRRAATFTVQLYASPVYLARRGTPRSEAELAGHDWVVFRTGPQKLKVASPGDAGGRRAAGPRSSATTCSSSATPLLAGSGLGTLPTFVAAPEVAAGRLVRVLPRFERPAGMLHIVSPASRQPPRKVTAFRDLVLEVLRARGIATPGWGRRRGAPDRNAAGPGAC